MDSRGNGSYTKWSRYRVIIEKLDQEQGGQSGENLKEYVPQTPKLGYGSDLLSDDIENATP